MTVFWAQAETLLIVVMVGSSYTELLANADFHLFLFVQICGATSVLSAFCSKRGNSHSRESPHNKNEFRQVFFQIRYIGRLVFTGSFYSWSANANFQTVALEACLYWDEFDIKGPHWMKKFPEKNSAMFRQSMRL